MLFLLKASLIQREEAIDPVDPHQVEDHCPDKAYTVVYDACFADEARVVGYVKRGRDRAENRVTGEE